MNKVLWGLPAPAEPLEDCSHTNDSGETSRRIFQLSPAQIADSQNCEPIKWLLF